MIQTSVLYDYYKKSNGLVTDSRKVTEGTIYFALTGERFDGNDFVDDALAAGARYAVVDRPSIVGEKIILVENVLETLQKLATYHRNQFNIPVIGITGSCGKTTTKELIKSVLSQSFNVVATKDNFNNHIGVPLSLLDIDEKTDIAVIEMGASAPGEIDFLVRLVNPTCGIITNVENAHIEGFGSFDAVKKTKGELYDYLRQKGLSAFVNNDNPVLQSMVHSRAGLCTVKYGLDAYGVQIVPPTADTPYLSFTLPIKTSKSNRTNPYKLVAANDVDASTERLAVKTHLIGGYNAINAVAAICVGLYFKVPLKKIIAAIEAYEPSNNRSQLLKSGTNQLIIDAYNANPASMTAALSNFSASNFPAPALILGDMKELGNISMEEHIRIVKTAFNIVSASHEGVLFLVGQNMREAVGVIDLRNEKVICFDDVDQVISYISEHPFKGSTILIKGSHSTHLDKLKEVL